jgi:hypothetical protein
MTSELPPAAKGTISVIGRAGYSSAAPAGAIESNAAKIAKGRADFLETGFMTAPCGSRHVNPPANAAQFK